MGLVLLLCSECDAKERPWPLHPKMVKQRWTDVDLAAVLTNHPRFDLAEL